MAPCLAMEHKYGLCSLTHISSGVLTGTSRHSDVISGPLAQGGASMALCYMRLTQAWPEYSCCMFGSKSSSPTRPSNPRSRDSSLAQQHGCPAHWRGLFQTDQQEQTNMPCPLPSSLPHLGYTAYGSQIINELPATCK